MQEKSSIKWAYIRELPTPDDVLDWLETYAGGKDLSNLS
jgi:hypothetical protein